MFWGAVLLISVVALAIVFWLIWRDKCRGGSRRAKPKASGFETQATKPQQKPDKPYNRVGDKDKYRRGSTSTAAANHRDYIQNLLEEPNKDRSQGYFQQNGMVAHPLLEDKPQFSPEVTGENNALPNEMDPEKAAAAQAQLTHAPTNSEQLQFTQSSAPTFTAH